MTTQHCDVACGASLAVRSMALAVDETCLTAICSDV